MNIHLPKEDAFQITDSTDWLSTPLASLSPIDAALRCQVCKDFYTTPMITSCAHTFCSLCIRRCLNNDGQCPACRTKDQEFKLRFNGAMEELVQAFVKARPAVLGFAREGGRASTPKRRRDELGEEDQDEEEEEMPRKRTRASTKRQPTQSSQRVVVIDSEDDIDEYIPDGYVNCPICNNQVKETLINTHLDSGCSEATSSKSRKPTPLRSLKPPPSKTITKPLERLASPNYSMLKDGPLRKKLTDHGLSAAGSRQLLIQRHTEWITLWNANCDATKPKTKGELKREMDVWERTQGGQARPRENHLQGAQIKDKDFDSAAWSSKHDGDFKSLIESARRKVVKPFANGNGNGEASSGTTPTTTDVEMESANPEVVVNPSSLPMRETSPEKRGVFQEDEVEDAHPPSSQYQRGMSVEKEAFISSIPTSNRAIQP